MIYSLVTDFAAQEVTAIIRNESDKLELKVTRTGIFLSHRYLSNSGHLSKRDRN